MKETKRKFVQFQDFISYIYPETKIIDEDGKIDRNLSKTITFQVTDKCNLACSYCYQINKGTRRMTFDIAKKLIDNLLSGEKGFAEYIGNSPAVILEFIGGEPFLEVELIDQICDYFKIKTIEMNHPWAYRYAISICSNGILYRDEKVQKFLQKHTSDCSFSVTVDGTKELHDSCRVFPDGSPSYDIAHDAAQDWKRRGYYMGSKITIAPQNVDFFSECLIQMLNDGYEDINANCVYEDVWQEGDGKRLYEQCKLFTDYCLDNDIDIEDFSLSLLVNSFGHPKQEDEIQNWCGGTGLMLACDPDGKLYPCLRYMESSLGSSQKPLIIGDVWNGIAQRDCEKNCISCLKKVNRKSQSTEECFYCPVAEGCSWCSAFNYQTYGTADKRATFICEMHKARCLAVVNYWNSFYKKQGRTEAVDLWLPRQMAVPIIGEEEYERLVALTKEQGGFVNEDQMLIRNYVRPE